MYYGLINSMKKGGVSYTARTTAFATATGITDVTILGALNTFDLGLISNSLDTKMKAVYPFLGGTSSTHKYNFMDARDLDVAFRLSFNGGMTHSATGVLPNGTNAYANTFLNTTTNLTLTSHSFGVYSRTESTITTIPIGNYDGASSVLQYGAAGNMCSGPVASGLISFTASPSKRLILGSRISASNFSGYRDGSFLAVNGLGIASLPNYNVFLFARNDAGSANLFSLNELCFAFLGDGLSSLEVTNFTNIVNNLQTALSRNV
jgi:hypothetical protein